METDNVKYLLLFLESISDKSNPDVLSAIHMATHIIFENEVRDLKKEYILGIAEFVDQEGNIDYSLSPPQDIKERLKQYNITTQDLKDAKNAMEKFKNIKNNIF